ncbi:GcrA family cell cycle regulator [Acidocella sp.]|uniref:GcrA family cell cycle regulator n=1 Tax=Acidocella sp. TaxID=50710 RepID=UPI00262D5023|nr:GcrA family cell cycle regulator [Acidocella sp.]
MEWTDETILRLRTLWSEGLSTAEIGRRLNISKNAVVGKAHRLNLPARPSPIRRSAGDAQPRQAPPKRTQGPTLPPLSASVAGPLPVLRAILPAAKSQQPRTAPCCWPIGEPGKPSFHFCNAAAAAGKPYCEEHAAIAYVRVRDKREDVA